MTVYDFLKDQGSLISGALAFVAGLLAYVAGKAQARAVVQSERQQRAHSMAIAIRLLDGVLLGIKEDLEQEIVYVSRGVEVAKGDGQHVKANLAVASRNRIKKPDLNIVWEQLGAKEPGWIKRYMRLDREISRLWTQEIIHDLEINKMLAEYRLLMQSVEILMSTLGSNIITEPNVVFLKEEDEYSDYHSA